MNITLLKKLLAQTNARRQAAEAALEPWTPPDGLRCKAIGMYTDKERRQALKLARIQRSKSPHLRQRLQAVHPRRLT